MSLKMSDAGAAEILRASQKDVSYIEHLHQNILDVVRRLFGPRLVIVYSSYLKLLTELLYYGFLTLSNSQTLGEEYTGILQVDRTFITIPHKMLQLLNIILQCGGELSMMNLATVLVKQVEGSNTIQPCAKNILTKLLSFCCYLLPLSQQINKGIFYIMGGYFHISKRITSINYILIRHWMKDHSFDRGFKILGTVTLMHSVLSAIIVLLKSREAKFQRNVDQGLKVIPSAESPKCVLCLCIIEHCSAIPCGHVFCWRCLCDCLNSKTECPVCREKTHESQIILLQNFL